MQCKEIPDFMVYGICRLDPEGVEEVVHGVNFPISEYFKFKYARFVRV